MAIITNEHGTFDVSDDLAQGIARHNARIAPLLGRSVSVTMPNGVVVIGVLSDDNHNTQITTAEGRRYRVWGDALEGLLSGERDPARLVCGWASTRASH